MTMYTYFDELPHMLFTSPSIRIINDKNGSEYLKIENTRDDSIVIEVHKGDEVNFVYRIAAKTPAEEDKGKIYVQQ